MLHYVAYHTEHEKSSEVCSRIAEAANIPLEHVKNYVEGTIPIVYGLFRGTDVVMRKAFWQNLPFLYVDHGYFKPGHYSGYYRINVSWTYFHIKMHYATPTKPDRLYKLGLTLNSMKVNKHKIAVICKPSFEGSLHLPLIKVYPEEWVDGVKYYLEANGFTAYVSTKHEKNRLMDWLNKCDVDLVVGHDSAAIVTALVHGYNVMNISMTNPFEVVDEDSRQKFFAMLANTQYKLCEITEDVLNNLVSTGCAVVLK